MAFYSGKSGSVTIANVVRSLTDWSLDVKVNILDTTNFTSGGFDENIPGTRGAEISASGPYNGPSGLNLDNSATFILKVSSAAGSPAFTLNANISSIKIDTSVKDLAKISYSATSTGAFTTVAP